MVVEAVDSPEMVPPYISRIYKVFDNVHMLRMDRWLHHHAVKTKLVGPDVGSRLKSEVMAGPLMMSLCGG